MRKHILVVEDDPQVRSLISAVLTVHGHRTTLCADGDQAINTIRRNPPDVVVLDLMLPRSNGFEVLEFIKAERRRMLRDVIVVTAAAQETLRHFDARLVRALLRKPIDVGELIDAVNRTAASAEDAGETIPLIERRRPRSDQDGGN